MAYTKNKEIVSRIVHKHDTEANWLKATSFTPLLGEIIVYDIDTTHEHERFKIGDGKTLVNNLPFQVDISDFEDYKVKQDIVVDPTASGNALAFIDTISQDEMGKITVTKKNVGKVSTAGTADKLASLTVTLTGDVTGTQTIQNSNSISIATDLSETGVTAGAYGTDGKTLNHGDNFTVPNFSVDAEGRLTAAANKTFTLPKASLYYVEGSGSTVDSTAKTASWKGTSTEITSYYPGLTVAYKLDNVGSDTTSLEINSLGAVTVVRNATTAVKTAYPVGTVAFLTYTVDNNGTAYWKAGDYDANTTYTNVKLGHGYATCDTAAATVAKTATLSTSYAVTAGGRVSIRFTNGNTVANPTLNISGKGAKYIYYQGAKLTDVNLIKPGDVVTFVYSSYYYIVAINGKYFDAQTVFGPTANAAPGYGGTFTVPSYTVTADGRVVAGADRTITLPAAVDISGKADSADLEALRTEFDEHTHSWNDLEDRPFGEELVNQVLVSERTVSISSGNNILRGITAQLEEGKSYTVNWDGTEYICVATRFDTMGYGPLIILGNPVLVDGGANDSGEPFVIGDSLLSDDGWAVKAKTTGNHTFSISGIVTTIHKLDSKYIDIPEEYVTETELIAKGYATIQSPTFKGEFTHGSREKNSVIGDNSFASGYDVIASGSYSHAEGFRVTASGAESHAEGYFTTASGKESHAEGFHATAAGDYSHAEGVNTIASGKSSHAEGNETTASGDYSHAEGNHTTANSQSQHVQGEYNILDTENLEGRGTYAHIVGNGTSDTARSNAHTLDWAGNAWFSGQVYVGGTDSGNGSQQLTTEEYVKEYVGNQITANAPNLSNYKTVQTAVSDPTASGSATAFIDSISQDANGKITVSKKNITAAALGLDRAMSFLGTTTTTLTDGATTNPITINSGSTTATKGDVVIVSGTDQEFIWTGSAWEEFGNASSHSIKGHTHTVTHKPAGTVNKTSITPAGTVSQPTFTGSAVNSGENTGTNFSAAPGGHKHSVTAAGTVSKPTFTGTEATITISHTPAGTVSQPTFTGSAVTSGKPDTTNVTTIYSITGVGSLPSASLSAGTAPSHTYTAPSLTASIANKCMTFSWSAGAHSFSAGTYPTLTFSAGSLPTRSSAISMPNTNHTHSVTAAGTVSQPTFTGSSVSGSTKYTPAGTVSQPTFTGSAVESGANTGTNTSVAPAKHKHSVTAAGTVSQPTFTGTAAEHSHTFTGTSATITTSGSSN